MSANQHIKTFLEALGFKSKMEFNIQKSINFKATLFQPT